MVCEIKFIFYVNVIYSRNTIIYVKYFLKQQNIEQNKINATTAKTIKYKEVISNLEVLSTLRQLNVDGVRFVYPFL